MKNREPELQAASFVAVGSFTPKLFHPGWLSRYNLIRDKEADNAEISIISKEVSVFSAEWFELRVVEDRFMILTTDPTKFKPIQDVVSGIFKVLEHVPVEAFGFNHHMDFRVNSCDEWQAFGDHYAPKDSWCPILTKPGMRTLIMEGKRENCEADYIRINIQPSAKVDPGVFIHINEHYSLKEPAKEEDPVKFLREMVDKSWEKFLQYSKASSEHLLQKGVNKEG